MWSGFFCSHLILSDLSLNLRPSDFIWFHLIPYTIILPDPFWCHLNLSDLTMSSKSPVRNTQSPPCIRMKHPLSWHTFNEGIDTKLLGYLPFGQTWSPMTSWRTCPKSLHIKVTLFMTHLWWRYRNKTCKEFSSGARMVNHNIQNNYVLQVSNQEPSMSFKQLFNLSERII